MPSSFFLSLIVMRLASLGAAVLLCASCATSQLDSQSTQAMRVCFYTPPEKVGEPGVLPDTSGWSLVSRRHADPRRDATNPYVTSGCSSKSHCYEYWFRKDTGDIRYCATDNCRVSSVGFRIVEGDWSVAEGNEFVCTS